MTKSENDFFCQPMKRIKNYSDIYDWELNLIDEDQKKEIDFWINQAGEYPNSILEIACGTGRITIPLLNKGFPVTAVDISSSMLDILKSKTGIYNNLQIIKKDMRFLDLKKKFDIAFITYGSFQLLINVDDQIKTLKAIAKHLNKKGRLIIDTHQGICDEPLSVSNVLLYDEFLDDKSRVQMYTSYKTDCRKKIRHWHDRYIINQMGKTLNIDNDISLKAVETDDMIFLAEKCGFSIKWIVGDFLSNPLKDDSPKAIYCLEKK